MGVRTGAGRIVIIGAGPCGLYLGAVLAGRGHQVIAVDRDGGPAADGSWRRRGVMQFHHAHAFRPQAVEPIKEALPAAYRAMLAAGGEPVALPTPDGGSWTAMRIRRQTFETALRAAAERTPGLTLRRGHVDRVLSERGRAAGIVVDGAPITADLVIDASGRSGHATDEPHRPMLAGGNCGIAYVDRQYQLHPGAEPGPLLNPVAWQGDYDGYQVIIFLHERGIFSVLIVRPTDQRDLVPLRHPEAFEAACRAIPTLADWTDPRRSRPISPVFPGGQLKNAYRGQCGADGRLALPGVIFVGDAVCTTTPNFGRGVATTMMQAEELLRLLEADPDPEVVGLAFDSWCERRMLPWVQDHARMDAATVERWRTGRIELTGKLPSDLIMTAADQDPRIGAVLAPYLAMTGLPDVLDPVEPLARAVYASGWRPPHAPGPTRSELAQLVGAAVPAGV